MMATTTSESTDPTRSFSGVIESKVQGVPLEYVRRRDSSFLVFLSVSDKWGTDRGLWSRPPYCTGELGQSGSITGPSLWTVTGGPVPKDPEGRVE